MRQKYMISREVTNNTLRVREYAVIDKDQRKLVAALPQPARYEYRCEETYAGDTIVRSISHGMNALMAILRTHNLFPIETHTRKIAESVMDLYRSSEYGSVELFFDDNDFVPV